VSWVVSGHNTPRSTTSSSPVRAQFTHTHTVHRSHVAFDIAFDSVREESINRITTHERDDDDDGCVDDATRESVHG